ncbi:phophatidylserine decarboxylase associated domain-containing protein [Williamsia sp. Leaf354]|uniref:phophatidylserine decarboxylase associated domain-containing protein n=1 Tax=Williamsia sp. Leaf354 TaxID=1736349 RepID=UPI0012E33234|nr:phophatidylserine decarboxylase associated domain-containing protein [Williamsia sp. Leaf354]
MTVDKSHPDSRRQGGWLPAEQDDLEQWLRGHSEKAESADGRVVHPVIVEFQELIDADPVVRMYLEKMIEQVPTGQDLPRPTRTGSPPVVASDRRGPHRRT